MISAKAKYQQSRRASLLVYVYSFKGNVMSDAKKGTYTFAEVRELLRLEDIKVEALQQQVSAEKHTVLELAEQLRVAEQQVDNMEEAQAATLSLLIEAHGWLQSVPDPYVSSVMKRINEHIKGEKGNE
jgi:hypothetical protein